MSRLNCFATASIFAFGPTRIGLINPSFAASTAPESELSSHGWATAVVTGSSAFAASISRWYCSCRLQLLDGGVETEDARAPPEALYASTGDVALQPSRMRGPAHLRWINPP